jgi:hypothetical protein
MQIEKLNYIRFTKPWMASKPSVPWLPLVGKTDIPRRPVDEVSSPFDSSAAAIHRIHIRIACNLGPD